MRSNTASQTRCKTAGKAQIVEDVKMKCSIDSKMLQRAHAILNTVPEADQEAVGAGHCNTEYLLVLNFSVEQVRVL